ncbi:MAG TPA: ATP synthase F1 subunit gamma [Vicinamibacterales bacterium]|jgi:F-type H+-transporting ATPase subunit gamma
MPSLIDIRRRIRAVKSTQQITKAMKMVATSNLRRSQERILNARPFALLATRVLNSVAARVDPSLHPLLAQPEAGPDEPTLLIVLTGDKGMSGSFNANIIRASANFILDHPEKKVTLGCIGRRGRDFFRRRGYPIQFELVNFTRKPEYGHAQAIAKEAIRMFTNGEVHRVFLAYNEFKSVLQQRIVIDQMLPITKAVFEPTDSSATVDYLYEPSAQQIFDGLLPRVVEVQTYRALLESAAAGNAAQMVAMDNATKNAGDVIDSLTLTMNKQRQAAITREIIEVVSGAQAL